MLNSSQLALIKASVPVLQTRGEEITRHFYQIKLAQQHGFAIRTFNRRFKLATGLTPVDYLQQRRLQAATSLLRDSNLTVAEIGQQVGYSDASYFTRLFRRQFSMTPQKYRESVRGKLFAPG